MDVLKVVLLVYLIGALTTCAHMLRGCDRNRLAEVTTQGAIQEMTPRWSRRQVAFLSAVLWPGLLLVLLIDGV